MASLKSVQAKAYENLATHDGKGASAYAYLAMEGQRLFADTLRIRMAQIGEGEYRRINFGHGMYAELVVCGDTPQQGQSADDATIVAMANTWTPTVRVCMDTERLLTIKACSWTHAEDLLAQVVSGVNTCSDPRYLYADINKALTSDQSHYVDDCTD